MTKLPVDKICMTIRILWLKKMQWHCMNVKYLEKISWRSTWRKWTISWGFTSERNTIVYKGSKILNLIMTALILCWSNWDWTTNETMATKIVKLIIIAIVWTLFWVVRSSDQRRAVPARPQPHKYTCSSACRPPHSQSLHLPRSRNPQEERFSSKATS